MRLRSDSTSFCEGGVGHLTDTLQEHLQKPLLHLVSHGHAFSGFCQKIIFWRLLLLLLLLLHVPANEEVAMGVLPVPVIMALAASLATWLHDHLRYAWRTQPWRA